MYEIIRKTYNTCKDIESNASLLVDVVKWGEKKFIERRNKTIEHFYIELLEGEVTEERINYEKENIKANDEQYYILLNLAISEEEQEKIFIYSNVYKYIRDNQNLNKKEKAKIIRLAKELPYSAIEIIPFIYIYSFFNTRDKSLSSFLTELSETHKYEINILTQHNIFEYNALSFNNRNFKIRNNNYLKEIANIFFIKEQLLPSSYNINIWKDEPVLILTNNPYQESEDVGKLKEILNTLFIHFEVKLYDNNPLGYYSKTFILFDKYEDYKASEILINKINKSPINTQIIKVALSHNIFASNIGNLGKNNNILNLNEETDINKIIKLFSN